MFFRRSNKKRLLEIMFDVMTLRNIVDVKRDEICKMAAYRRGEIIYCADTTYTYVIDKLEELESKLKALV